MKAKRRVARDARQLYRLCRVNGVLQPDRVRQIAQQITTSHRRGGLAVLTEFARLVRLDRERAMAVVESATPLGGAVREHVRANLARLYGPGVETAFAENPGLIGGMRIRVGSDVYDGSVRGRLAALEANL